MYTCSSCDTRPSRAVTVISRRAMLSESSAVVRRAGQGAACDGRIRGCRDCGFWWGCESRGDVVDDKRDVHVAGGGPGVGRVSRVVE